MSEPVKLLHFTLGGPWFGRMNKGGDAWMAEFAQMLVGTNPKAVAHAEWPPANPPNVHVHFKLDLSEVH